MTTAAEMGVVLTVMEAQKSSVKPPLVWCSHRGIPVDKSACQDSGGGNLHGEGIHDSGYALTRSRRHGHGDDLT